MYPSKDMKLDKIINKGNLLYSVTQEPIGEILQLGTINIPQVEEKVRVIESFTERLQKTKDKFKRP